MTRYGGIRLGDSHTGGGTMLEASGFPVNGINLCLIGDHGFCPTHNGSFPLVSTGNPFGFSVNGRQAVYEPAKLACGCSAISSCREFFAWADDTAPAPFPARTGFAPSSRHSQAMGSLESTKSKIYDEQFQLHYSNGSPASGIKYKIVSASGLVAAGVTNAEGKTSRLVTLAAETLHLFLVK